MRKVLAVLVLSAIAAMPVLADSVAREGNVPPTYTVYENILGRGPALVASITEGVFTDVGVFYQAALTAAGYPADLIYDPLGVWPSLTNYDVVAVTTNDDWWSTPGFNAADEAVLAGYLDTGGLVIFEGQDYLYMRGTHVGFPQNYFGIAGAQQDLANNDTVLEWWGTAGGPLDGMNQTVNACFASNGFYTDGITPAMQGLATWSTSSYPGPVEGGSVVANAVFSTIAMGCGDLNPVVAAEMQYLAGCSPVENASWGAVKSMFK